MPRFLWGEFDWTLTLLAGPFLLAVPLLWVGLRPKMFRIERAIVWILVAVLASALLTMDGIGVVDLIRGQIADGMAPLIVSLGFLAMGTILVLLNRRRMGSSEQIAVTVAYAAYLANAAICVPAFESHRNIGWYVTILVCCLMIFELSWRTACLQRLQTNVAP